MVKWSRDKRGRVFWYDGATGYRVKAPKPSERPREYHVDRRGRGYWLWGDTRQRAPKPGWDEAPRYDRIGRPLDSTGRQVPRKALLSEPVLAPAPEPPKPKRPKKAPGGPVRPKRRPPVRYQVRKASEPIPGFHHGAGAYFTRPTESSPAGLEKIFDRWLQGAVARSPMASASEIGFRQYGVVFKVQAPLDTQALAELTQQLEGEPVQLVFRTMGDGEWEIWAHGNRPNRQTKAVEQKGYRAVAAGMKRVTSAAQTIAEFLEDWGDYYWYEYIETDDDIYEG